MSTCIIILTHPNTDKKLEILSNSLSRLVKTNYPIFVFANMYVNPKYLTNATDFIFTGENKLISASDILSLEKVRDARESTKYRLYLNFENHSITYFPINYGTEKNLLVPIIIHGLYDFLAFFALIRMYRKSL